MTATEGRITRDDLEASFQAVKDEIDRTTDDAKSRILPAITIGAILLLVIAYLIGKRVGRTESTVVEIRRI